MIKLAIIDIDGMFYHSLRDTFKASITIFKEKFDNLIKQTGATHYVAFYSMGRYFRHKIDPEYKGNRSGKPIHKYYKAVKEWAIAEYDLQYMEKVEADDLCAYWMRHPIEGLVISETIICSPDKDLLKSLPGKHFNYSYKLENKDKPESVIKGWWVETTLTDSEQFRVEQLLLGDTGDNILGCGVRVPKVYATGAKKGQSYLSRKGFKPAQFKTLVEKCKGDNKELYIQAFLVFTESFGLDRGVYELQKNQRLLHLLGTNEDFLREVGVIPTFPLVTSISKSTEEKPEVIPDF